jgi:hypothetical protein
MNMHEQCAPSKLVASTTAPSPESWFGLLIRRVAAWVKECADHYTAAAAYEHPSRLSDRGLNHLGLSRDILSRDLSGWAE